MKLRSSETPARQAPANRYTARFQAYARSCGVEPESCKAGVDFISWVTAQLKEWKRETGTTGALTQAHHDAFDRWLVAVSTGGTGV